MANSKTGHPSGNSSQKNLPAKIAPSASSALAGLSGVKVRVTAILGSAEITFDRAVELDPESLLVVNRSKDDPVDLCVNGEVVARGKLVVVGDTYGVQITELVEHKSHR
ncbi:MAG: FliM/FliN family flagellar motor C-terminal domain-containing protein [bacterium]|nr:FliM/FliN family flagellar motor C-terminal domain-containing protein [bacterium]